MRGSTAVVPLACGHSGRHALRHLGRGVADVDLSAGDAVAAAIQRNALRQAGNGVLRRGVGRRMRARHVRGDRAIVDDAPAHRFLRLHQFDCLLRAQKRTREVDPYHLHPLLVAEFFHRNGRSVGAGVVEQHVEPPESLLSLGEQRSHRIGLRHVRRHREHPPSSRSRRGRRLLQCIAPSVPPAPPNIPRLAKRAKRPAQSHSPRPLPKRSCRFQPYFCQFNTTNS